ncbi:tail protein [Enterococcus phage EFDG1]|uniref:Capsid and scaffold protein n=1 Tax=Enterococcus phage EFDG1 TaxID=1597976 RepID=A0A0C5JZJ3_9CAUD|nr:tail protein [Enterococcus phage EFDG1]AJP61445.1 capsid and scaffold protein [Enterococcus phage EFDG1]
MALSGSKYTAFARHRLVLEWRASQNVAGNYSDVSIWLYLQSMDSYGALYAPAVGQAQVTANGVKQTENATSQLNAYQKKLLLAKVWRVNHNADGSKSFSISASYFVNVTYSGVYYGTISIPSFSVSLNKIPRKSSLNPVPDLNIPNKLGVSITRQSSSFTHNLTVWVANRTNPTLDNDSHWVYLNSIENVGTSGTFTFSVANFTEMFKRMGTSTEWVGKVKLWTNGLSESVPSQQRTFRIKPPMNAQASGGKLKVKAGEKITVNLSNFQSDGNFKYTGVFNYRGVSIPVATNVHANSMTLTLTQANVDSILKESPDDAGTWGQVRVTSYYNGVQYRTPWTGQHIDCTIPKEDYLPVINGTPTYTDLSSEATNVTGSNQVALQSKSNIRVTIPANFATGQGFSTIKTVQASLGGATKTANYNASGFNIDIGAPNEGTASTLVVTVLDGRGFSTSWTKTVQVYPYSNPDVNYTIARRNNFEVDTELAVSSSWAPVTIGGVNKNAITSVTYATKRSGTSTWGAETPLTFSTDGAKVIVPTTVVQLPNEYSWNFRLTIKDKFGSFSKEANISAGKPIMFIDAVRESVGFGNLTGTGENRNLNGVIEIEAERYHSSGKTGIQMNNSDISGLNGIFFSNDRMDNDGEGIHFIKSGKDVNSPNQGQDYDRFYMRDNGFYVNHDGTPIFKVTDNGRMYYPASHLWSGGWYMSGTQNITPSKPMSECRNGWVLMWAKYQNSTQTWNDVVQVYLGKDLVTTHSGLGVRLLFGGYGNVVIHKYLTITDTEVRGNASNTNASLNADRAILVRVHEW